MESEIARLRDLLGKANALARIRLERIKELEENERMRKMAREIEEDFRQSTKAAPQAAQPERKPLTDEQALEVILSCGSEVSGRIKLTVDRGPYEVTEPTFVAMKFIRAIERAHDIAAISGKEDK